MEPGWEDNMEDVPAATGEEQHSGARNSAKKKLQRGTYSLNCQHIIPFWWEIIAGCVCWWVGKNKNW